ncbi:hypothetical protein [Leptolyngbya sp. FACHB-711]|uniref:hypothetical protein n=1 Tax=unclassified Leptolyngbya TaxID=2650499 RepID=UPI0016850B60|nr:hypothetical protein [Leptolyngbya sp. FACHB-711]MBD1849422.1 hypothetical protein [Cyanobacteria bacterium FACHB-502]MBD2024110.1 hypothetical protein [Leptolyngbya sp. FACHB-711]
MVKGDNCLNHARIEAILNALRQSKLDSSQPFIVAVQAQIDRAATDSFAWKLFELWLEGAPSRENWAMMAVGLPLMQINGIARCTRSAVRNHKICPGSSLSG